MNEVMQALTAAWELRWVVVFVAAVTGGALYADRVTTRHADPAGEAAVVVPAQDGAVD